MDPDVEERLRDHALKVAIDDGLFAISGPESEVERRRRLVLAGLLWAATTTVLDHMFSDVALLEHPAEALTLVDVRDDLQVLDGLPERFHAHVNLGTARCFLVVMIDLSTRVTRGWSPLDSVAEELMLRLLLDEVETLAEIWEVDLTEGWREMLEDRLFEDLDHELLFDRALDGFEDDPTFVGPPGMTSMSFADWFAPFRARTSPFVENMLPPAPGP